MKSIRQKIFLVIFLITCAIGVSSILYTNKGFSLSSKESDIPGCGLKSNELDTTERIGVRLFSFNCASCHSIHKDLTGPALAGFQNRISSDLFYSVVKEPNMAFSKSNYLKKQKTIYKLDHPSFPSLSPKEINYIRYYIEQAILPVQ